MSKQNPREWAWIDGNSETVLVEKSAYDNLKQHAEKLAEALEKCSLGYQVYDHNTGQTGFKLYPESFYAEEVLKEYRKWKDGESQVKISPEMLAKSEAMRKEISDTHEQRMAEALKNLPKTN